MKQIKKIRIENVKGKKEFSCEFNDFHANYMNLLVAPNGYGKSTIAVAFEALKGNKMELKKQDIFEKNEANKPILEIELAGENSAVYTADSVYNNIKKNISILVINSPVYAKGKSKNFGRFSTSEALMSVEEIIIEDKIPRNVDIKEIKMENEFPGLGKIFFKLKDILHNAHDMNFIVELIPDIKKIYSQKMTMKKINCFCDMLNNLLKKGNADQIRDRINETDIEDFLINPKISQFIEQIKNIVCLPCNKNNNKEVCIIAIQLIKMIEEDENDFKNALMWLQYQELKESIDENIKLFNTTNRRIMAQVKKGKLLVQFPAANEMSNGERDVITFIIQILKFKSTFNKDTGILIMDEIFDYLDGSNMLIAQYYLAKYIDIFKKEGKAFFPIILTHLDPYLFNNYYLKNIKVHYLKEFANTSGKDMINFLKIRTNKVTYPDLVNKIEKGYIHFYDINIILTDEEQNIIGSNKYINSTTFKNMINEQVNNYINGSSYDPLKVICAIRVKVEEIAYIMLDSEEEKTEFLNTYTTSKKLNYVEEHVGGVSENLYLLAPLYNDGLHLDLRDDNKNKNKVKSTCLKLDNLVIKKIVEEIFSDNYGVIEL